MRDRQTDRQTYAWQFSDLVGVEHEFLERGGVSQHVVGNREEVAVSLVDVVDLLVARLEQRQTAQHCRPRAVQRQQVTRSTAP